MITTFGKPKPTVGTPIPAHPEGPVMGRDMEMVYTDGACLNNSSNKAQVGYRAWYGESDPRNMSGRVQHRVQSNQTGELMAILMVVKQHNTEGDLQIISDSKYVIEGLTKHLCRW